MRAAADLPKQAAQQPWLIKQNYILDMLTMKLGRMEDRILSFGRTLSVVRAEVTQETPAASLARD